jgi:CO dehydrogenase/acetyl-CoA synthase beta subunit
MKQQTQDLSKDIKAQEEQNQKKIDRLKELQTTSKNPKLRREKQGKQIEEEEEEKEEEKGRISSFFPLPLFISSIYPKRLSSQEGQTTLVRDHRRSGFLL